MLELIDKDLKEVNNTIGTELKQATYIELKENMTMTQQIANLNRKIETMIKNQVKILEL